MMGEHTGATPQDAAPADDAQIKQAELAIKEREVAVKEGELQLKRNEASSAAWRSPLVLSVLGAALAAAGNAGVSYFNAKQQRELEDRRSEQARILEMIKTGSPDKAAENLKFLVDAGLVTDPSVSVRLGKFLNDRKPGTGPALPTPAGNTIAERLAQAEETPTSPAPGDSSRYRIKNHVLFDASGKPVTVAEAMAKGSGRLAATRAIVLHYTADSASGAAEQFMSASRPGLAPMQASAHVIIRRDGSVTQLVAFDVPAFHAGSGTWKDLTNLNKYSIGVMFENRGRLKQADGKWPLDDDEVLVIRGNGADEGWERYTAAQLETARELLKALGRAYPSIEAVLRHSEVSRGRKVDPGPALDIEPLAAALQQGRQMAAASPAVAGAGKR
jgi:N-acetyl-anhydromuramyl-L-alanine amidase AmpD